ncbi:sugar phosphate isomerase/epimerase family protein [Cellulosimicrobium arenosum]|uniref:Sugar phosphate isomerase/epimerase n=1 Tax=Cellulosimicrobium arenosum TaxID=2708133 RepID=A0A927J1Q5_9MICO|nr:sugar phosphate isomerase/epimerase family protein [Cellulosimicrobium arenosum]MBD8080319.1 sugar phosphate isomerase/epimerase [Cellulosimicrobium arenosum]
MPDATTERPPTEPGEPRNHVTLSTASVYPRRAAYAFEAAADLGYDGMEVMVWSDEATQDADALLKLSAEHGMPIRSIHAPTLLVSQRVWGRAPGPKLRHTVEMAQEVGASTVVVHPPFRWQYKYAREFADLVRELDGAGGVTVAVENMYPWRGRKREMKAYLPGWDPTDHGYDHVTLDISHAAVARQDALGLLDVFDGRLAHLHLADGTASFKDEHLVPGRGDQPCDKVLGELVRRGWSGDVVVEITTRRARTAAERREDLAASLFFARTYLTPGDHPPYEPPPGHAHRHLDAWDEDDLVDDDEDGDGPAGTRLT